MKQRKTERLSKTVQLLVKSERGEILATVYVEGKRAEQYNNNPEQFIETKREYYQQCFKSYKISVVQA